MVEIKIMRRGVTGWMFNLMNILQLYLIRVTFNNFNLYGGI